jgi:cytochrome c oxidase subunit 2
MTSKPLVRRCGAVTRPVAAAVLGLFGLPAFAAYQLDFQPPVTPVAEKIMNLHHLILAICVVIFVIVFSFMFWSIFAHRKSRGAKPAQFHDNTALEVIWTVIPFLILVGMAIPSAATLIEMEDVSKSDMTVKITGYQWKWQYEYPDHGVSFFSNLATPREQIEGKAEKGEHYLLEVDNPLVLPTGKKVRFVITANDVIHAWWVPQLGVKKDAIPGFVNEVWTRIDKPGTYRGQCAELCGKDHGFMPIVVEAVPPEDFDKWVSVQKAKAAAATAEAGKTWSREELLAKGKQIYTSACAACHGPNGEGVGPFPKMAGSKVANGPLSGHLNIVLNGKPGTAMAAFGPQLNDAEIAAVVTYERNSFGNTAGDVVQPAQVAEARKGGAAGVAKK